MHFRIKPVPETDLQARMNTFTVCYFACSQVWLPTVQDVLHADWQEVWHSPQPPFFTVFCSFVVFKVLMCFIMNSPFTCMLSRNRKPVPVYSSACNCFHARYGRYLARNVPEKSYETERYGTYHATNEGVCSWAQFAQEIFRLAGKDVRVNAVPTSRYPTRAARPLNSRMSKDKLERMGFSRLPTWQDALARYLTEIEGARSV